MDKFYKEVCLTVKERRENAGGGERIEGMCF